MSPRAAAGSAELSRGAESGEAAPPQRTLPLEGCGARVGEKQPGHLVKREEWKKKS